MEGLFPEGIRTHRGALRLTFRYEGDSLELVSNQPVDVTVVGWDPIGEALEGHGFWAELQDASGQVLYRKVAQDPTHGWEAFSPEGDISRVSGISLQGTFTILVPDISGAQEVVLQGSFEAEGAARRSRELGRFPIGQGKDQEPR
jgi:hypothetical protein